MRSPKTYVRDSGIVHTLLRLDDLRPERTFLVYSGDERYPKGEGVEAIGVGEMATELAGLQSDTRAPSSR